MKQFHCILGLLFSFPLLVFSQSNEGVDFWMTYLDHFDRGQEEKVLMLTAAQKTEVRVSIPGINWRRNLTIDPGKVSLLGIPDAATTLGSETVDKNAVHIEASAPIAVYAHQYATFRSEAAMILPTASLGTAYYAMTYGAYDRNNEVYPAQFCIVAVENDTEIRFTPSTRTVKGVAPGQTGTIRLQQGETYQVQSVLGNGADMTGSFISGNKAFALFAGNMWTQVPNGCDSRDNLYEQIPPFSTWGKKYALVPSAESNGDYIKILSATNTEVRLLGPRPQRFTLSAGNPVEFLLTQPAILESDAQLLVGQFFQGNKCNGLGGDIGDPSFVLLSGIEQSRENVTLYSSEFQNIDQNYLSLVARTNDIGLVQVDGKPFALWTPFTGDPDYSYAIVSVRDGVHSLEAKGCGVSVIAYGYGSAESYAYTGGASFKPISPKALPDSACTLQELSFSTGLDPKTFTFRWDLGDGTRSSVPEPKHSYLREASYAVKVVYTNTCNGQKDSLESMLVASAAPDVSVKGDTSVCEGSTVSFRANGPQGISYTWEGPSGFTSGNQLLILSSVRPTLTGLFTVRGNSGACAGAADSVRLRVLPAPQPNLGPDTSLCPGESFTKKLDDFLNYRWQDGSDDASYTFDKGGIYHVTVGDALGCRGTDTLVVSERCPVILYIPNAFSPNGDQINDTFDILLENATQYTLEIYDRWGGLLFSTSDLNVSWDGNTGNGNRAPEGVYLYKLLYQGVSDRNIPFTGKRVGSVTLIR